VLGNIVYSGISGDLFTGNNYLKDFCLLGESIGLQKEIFAEKLGLSLKSIEDSQVVIAKEYIYKGYEILVEYADDELLGATVAKLSRSSVELMVKSASAEQTLRQGLKAIEQVFLISQSGAGSNIIVDETLVRWQFTPMVKEQRFYSLIASVNLFVAKKLISLLLEKELVLSYINLEEEFSEYYCDYKFMYNCQINFGQTVNEIAFDVSWLNEPIKCNYNKVKPQLRIPLSLTYYSQVSLGIVEKIQHILALCPYSNFPSQQSLAHKLGMSVRTMQRKLTNEDINYMKIKDAVRQRKALFYLEHTEKAFEEVSHRCGFSELASFSRAFMRWTGYSPSKYKERNKANATQLTNYVKN